MNTHVGIIYSEELAEWKRCIVESVSDFFKNKSSVNICACTVEDYADKKKQQQIHQKTEWSKAAVIIIMISPKFIESLEASNLAFPRLPQTSKVFFFFCGVDMECLEGSKDRFHGYEKIVKYGHENVRDLVETTVDLLLLLVRSDLDRSSFDVRQSQFETFSKKPEGNSFALIPRNVLLEEGTCTMIMTFDEDVNSDDEVIIKLGGVCEEQKIKAEKMTPNVYRFCLKTNTLSIGEGTVKASVGNTRLAPQTFEVHSKAECHQLYNILDAIFDCSSKSTWKPSLDELDDVISRSITSSYKAEPPAGPESLDRPTFLQLARKYNLNACLSKLSGTGKSKLPEPPPHDSYYCTTRLSRKSSTTDVVKVNAMTTKNPPSSQNSNHNEPSLPKSQQELVDIINKVISGEILFDDANTIVKYWHLRHGTKEKTQLKKLTFTSGMKISDPIPSRTSEIPSEKSAALVRDSAGNAPFVCPKVCEASREDESKRRLLKSSSPNPSKSKLPVEVPTALSKSESLDPGVRKTLNQPSPLAQNVRHPPALPKPKPKPTEKSVYLSMDGFSEGERLSSPSLRPTSNTVLKNVPRVTQGCFKNEGAGNYINVNDRMHQAMPPKDRRKI